MKTVILLGGLVAAAVAAEPVSGQDFDYAGYEDLFREPVTVSATGKPERVSDSPVLMTVITAEDIARSGARDIPTLLGRLPGVDITHSTAGVTSVGLGGYVQPSASRVMVLINGRQVYFNGLGDIFWSSLPVELEEIRQIEVISGPQSALYGFNAVDGVINIVTFDPIDDHVDETRARVGTQARRDVEASTTQSFGDGAGLRLTAAADHVDDHGSVGRRPVSEAAPLDPGRRAFSLDGGVRVGDFGRLGLEASHTDISQRSIFENLFFDARTKTDALKGSYSVDTSLGLVGSSLSYTGVDMPWIQARVFGGYHLFERSGDAQLSDVVKLGGDDIVRAGLEGRRDRLDAPGLVGGRLSGDLAAGSVMWEHRFLPSLSAVNAVRYDYFKLGRSGTVLAQDIFRNADFDRSDQGASVNSALIQKLGSDDALRLSFSRGLALPSLAEFAELGRFPRPSTGLLFFGNPDLRAAGIYSYQGAWDHQFRDLDAVGRLSLIHDWTVNRFGTVYRRAGGAQVQMPAMTGGSVTNGLQLSIDRKTMDGWTWGANYTYQRVHEHPDRGLRDGAPLNKVVAHAGYAWRSWEADLYGTYASETDAILVTSPRQRAAQSVPIKETTTLSPRLSWRPVDSLTIELAAENLWPYQDTRYFKLDTSYYLTVRFSY
jgi:iron complex outermembrane receptor protein